MKKIVAILLALCLCPLCAWAETAETPVESDYAELIRAIYEANTLENLFSRHKSLQFLFTDPEAPDGYDVIWETQDVYYQSFADWFAHWEKDQVYCEMRWDQEADNFSVTAGYDYAQYYYAYCFADSEEDVVDPEHETVTGCREEDGRLILTIECDETLSRQAMEDMSLAYAGETVLSRMIVDAATYEIMDFCKYLEADGEEQVISSCRVSYDRSEPVACRALRAAIDRVGVETMNVNYIVDPGTDHEAAKTITVPANTNCYALCDGPYVYFYDAEQTIVSGWDKMSDLTVYLYTNPDEALMQRFEELIAAASAEGLVLKDAEGNVLEDGATLSGSYYYKVYVEGVPEDYKGIQTAWVRDVENAEAPEDWEAIRYLYEDEIGRYIRVIPAIGGEYTQETMFARLDENDPDMIRINFEYDRETSKETAPPELINEEDPKVGQTDYDLQWNPVEGAEFYEMLWITPSGNYFYYVVTDPEFPLSGLEGALDEAGEYTLYVIPYGDGMPFTYGAWTCDVTEPEEEP